MKFTLAHQSLTDKSGNPVSEIQLFKTGDFDHWSGTEFTVDDQFMDNMIENFNALQASAKDQKVIPIDYNHGSLAIGADDAKAAGWITKLTKKEDGLYATVEWTEEAANYIRKGEYRYISPEFGIDPTDEYGQEVDGAFLYAAAMTNRPFLKGMAPLELNQKNEWLLARLNSATRKIQGGDPMKEKIAKLLSLKEAAEDQVIAAVEAMQTKFNAIVKALSLTEGEDPIKKAETLVAKAADQQGEIAKLNEKVQQIEADHKKVSATAEVDRLISEKKLIPVQRDFAIKMFLSGKETFDEYLKCTPPPVQLQNPKGSGAGSDGGESDDYEKAVAAKLQANPKMDVLTASREVQKENPKLAEQHANRSN